MGSNKQAIEALRGGTDAWNAYIEKNGRPEYLEGIVQNKEGARIDLKNVDISDIRVGVSGLTFTNCDMSEANLSGMDTRSIGAIDSRLSIQHSKLDDANLSRTDFSDLDIRNSSAKRTNFSGSTLSRAIIRNSDLNRANLSDVEAKSSIPNSHSIQIKNSNLDNAVLDGANIPTALIERSSLNHVTANGANLSGTSMRGVQSQHSSFAGAKLENIEAQELRSLSQHEEGEDKGISNFYATSFEKADLKGANFSRADLRHADFKGADLKGADFSNAQTSQIKIDDETDLEGVLIPQSESQEKPKSAAEEYDPYEKATKATPKLSADFNKAIEQTGFKPYNPPATTAPTPVVAADDYQQQAPAALAV